MAFVLSVENFERYLALSLLLANHNIADIRMKRIKQRGDHDCVLACIAMLGNISYEKAKILTSNWNWNDKGPNGAATSRLLTKTLGWTIKEQNQVSLLELKHHALLIIDQGNVPYNHAVVWDCQQKRVICPSVRSFPYWNTPFIEGSLKGYQENLLFVYEIITRKIL